MAEAQTLFLAARNAECLAALDGDPSAEAAALRARCFLRLREPQRAVEELRRQAVAKLEDARKAEHHVVLAAAYLRSGSRLKSHRYDEAAQIVASELGGGAAAELAVYRAVAAWSERDLAQAERHAFAGLEIRRVRGDRYPRRLSLTRAQLYETLSLVAASREEYTRQAHFLDAAWHAGSEPGEPRDEWVRASLLRNYTPLVWDLALEEKARFLETESEHFAWSPETADVRWAVKRALGWYAAVSGNHLVAFQRFRDAIDLAPTAPYRLGSVLDRAFLAAEMGQTMILREEMARAYDLATSIDWHHVTGHGITVLLSMVEAYAREDARAARAWLRMYDRNRAMPESLLLLASHDRRQTAMELDAQAAVLAAEGRADAAAAAWRKSLAIWDALDHRWRAARTAIALAEITRAADDFHDARRRTEAFKASWLGGRTSRMEESRKGA